MADNLPLLMFPKAMRATPERNSFPPSRTHKPKPHRQKQRLQAKFDYIQSFFSTETVRLQNNPFGLEPEAVLVIRTKGEYIDLTKAFKEINFEILSDEEDEKEDPDEDFFLIGNDGKRKTGDISQQLFLSMSNQASLLKFLRQWQRYVVGEDAPHGLGTLYKLFSQIDYIDYWNTENRLKEAGFYDWMLEELDGCLPEEEHCFNIELWFRQKETERKRAESVVKSHLEGLGAKIVTSYCSVSTMFHAIKVKAMTATLKQLISDPFDNELMGTGQDLLEYNGIMYFSKPTSLNLTSGKETETESLSFGEYYGEPRIALLDGFPLAGHEALQEALEIDDPDDIIAEYQVGDRKHGTAMASLILHGDLNDPNRQSLNSKLYVRPVMVPDAASMHYPVETLIPDKFPEDVLERALIRMFVGEGNENPVAPDVKVINFSLGDPNKLFAKRITSWARMIEYLSYRFNVLFIISAGNHVNHLELDDEDILKESSPSEIRRRTVGYRYNNRFSRTIMAPAEAINALCVGASHQDYCNSDFILGNRIDILPVGDNEQHPSPITPMGGGFRGCIKPEILVPGGRQLYQSSPLSQNFRPSLSSLGPGQKTATTFPNGLLNQYSHSRGTSNSAALTTHEAGHFLEIIDGLRRQQEGVSITEAHIPVLLKAMLVHGALPLKSESEEFWEIANESPSPPNSRHKRRWLASYSAYGVPDFNRVHACTSQRATVIGCDRIHPDLRIHRFELPLPQEFDRYDKLRRLTITLAWMSPINPRHRQYFRGKLSFKLVDKSSVYKQRGEGRKVAKKFKPGVDSYFDPNQM